MKSQDDVDMLDRIWYSAKCKKHQNSDLRCSACYDIFRDLLILYYHPFEFDNKRILRGLFDD